MKKVLVVVMTMFLAASALPQTKPGPMPKAHETMQMEEKGLAADSGRLGMHERQLALEERAQKYALDKEQMEKNFKKGIDEEMCPGGHWGMNHWDTYGGTPMRHLMFAKAVFGMIFCTVMLLLNILFTILVSIDMAKNNRFNGLWIPILLIAGVPGAAIYALFRIGDIVQRQVK